MFFGRQAEGADDDWEDEPDQTQPNDPKEENKKTNTTQFYQLLELPKDATTQQIKKSFRKKALKEHPDKGGDPSKFKRLKEAYDTLLNPEKRQLYDEYGEEGVENGGPPGSGGLFWNGQRDNRPKKMKPKLVQIEVTLEEVYFGKTKEVTIKRFRICSECQGKGGSSVVKCDACSGNGVTIKMAQLGPGMYTQVQVPCQKCQATGETVKEEDKCKSCEGKKVKQQEKTLEVAIQQGVPDSHDYILCGESDEYPGAMAGDVYVRINIAKHDRFERRGADLVHHQQITLLQALTGVTTTITHLDGKEYVIATSPGQILENKQLKTIHRLGMPFFKDPISHGNLYFEFKVVFPPKNSLNPEQEQLLRKAFDYTSKNDGLQKLQRAAPLSNFTEEELNPKAGLQQQQEQEQGQGQGIPCQQQ